MRFRLVPNGGRWSGTTLRTGELMVTPGTLRQLLAACGRVDGLRIETDGDSDYLVVGPVPPATIVDADFSRRRDLRRREDRALRREGV